MKSYGPTLPISEEVHAEKYRQKSESFSEAMERIARILGDNDTHRASLLDILLNQRFLPAGRIQSAIGSPRNVTPYNCFVSGVIEDDSNSIMQRVHEAYTTMRLGGGIGYDFSLLRPDGDLIRSLDSAASGPISFMGIFDAVCGTVKSAGHRRGAQMGVLRIDHPDIEAFIEAKQNSDRLTNFNISVAVTDEFMDSLRDNKPFPLHFNGRVYRTVDPSYLWDKLMRATWDWAEPGVLFIDRINWKNNLYYIENIVATNPCAEQPLPSYGACLLGSFNLVKYVQRVKDGGGTSEELLNRGYYFDFAQFRDDIRVAVVAMDNVVDVASYPLEQQWKEATSKRRMGLGVTGVANTIERLGHHYGSVQFLLVLEAILKVLRDTAYDTSINLAITKGPFPEFDREKYLKSNFIKTLPQELRDDIFEFGIRNSHLLSIAPTGTISLTADNISSGIEPVFSHEYTRTINMPDGVRKETIQDYGVREWGIRGRTSDEVTPEEHIAVLGLASRYVDSAVSKTCNVGADVTFDEFKNIYLRAYELGASGCTTFRAMGKRFGVLNKTAGELVDADSVGAACYIDPETGSKSCA